MTVAHPWADVETTLQARMETGPGPARLSPSLARAGVRAIRCHWTPFPCSIATLPKAGGCSDWAYGRNEPDMQRPPLPGGRGLCTTEQAGAHSLQFWTYAPWTAWLLAALAVRPASVMRCQLSTRRE